MEPYITSTPKSGMVVKYDLPDGGNGRIHPGTDVAKVLVALHRGEDPRQTTNVGYLRPTLYKLRQRGLVTAIVGGYNLTNTGRNVAELLTTLG